MNTLLPAALIDFMRAHHYDPHKLNRSGSGFLRFAVGNDKNGSASGFVKVLADKEAAIFGDFKSGERFVWHAKEQGKLSPAGRDARRSLMEKARQEADEERGRLRAAASHKAAELYKAAEVARADHPYLVKKGILPCGEIRQHGAQLLIPVYVDDKLASLQFIEADGTKRFLTDGETKGGCLLLGAPSQIVCVAEGYATARSIHEATGHAVAVAFNAGNLLAVSQGLRSRLSDASLIICADCDQWTEGNPGLSEARKAAQAVGAKLAIPDFSKCDLASHPSDFNDLHRLVGSDSVRHDLSAAQLIESAPVRIPKTAGIIVETAAPPLVDSHIPLAPPHMSPEGFPPFLRDIVEAACSNSEAHEVAVAANVIAYFSAIIGRGVYQRIGDVEIHCRPFVLIVGKSGKARKGTAEATVRKIFKLSEKICRERHGIDEPLLVHTGGLSTGEGMAYMIRDPLAPDNKGRGGDPGVPDKRMLAIESEFDNVFTQLRRDSNTLSATLRNVFDGRDIEPMTKTNPIKATKPHVVLVGHITAHELREKSTDNDVANGLLNRLMMLHVFRPKLVALPKPTKDEKLQELAGRAADAIRLATDGDVHGNNIWEVTLSEAAQTLWVGKYEHVTRDREGKGGSLLARSEMYARMFAMIFATMDGRRLIEPRDLEAAFAWLEYWAASVTYVFNCHDDEGQLEPFVIEVLNIIKAKPGITLGAVQEHWRNKRIKQVNNALETLLNLAPPLVVESKVPTTGRHARAYCAYEKK